MTDELAVDYSFARPNPHTIKAAGYAGVLRYLCPLPNTKALTKSELDQLRGVGLAVGVVWESTAGRAKDGATAGAADGAAANRQADDLGFPAGVPIYFAVDFDAQAGDMASIAAYLLAARGGRPVGVYGGYFLVEAMAAHNAATWFWQTEAWSRGKVSDKAHILQRAKPTPVPNTDENVLLRSRGGLWWPTQAPPVQQPAPTQPSQTWRFTYGGIAMAQYEWVIPLDDNGEASAFIPLTGPTDATGVTKGQLISLTAPGVHDKYDPETHDSDCAVFTVGWRESTAGKLRAVVKGTPKAEAHLLVVTTG